MANTRDSAFLDATIDLFKDLHQICPTIVIPDDFDPTLDECKQILAQLREWTKNWEKVRI